MPKSAESQVRESPGHLALDGKTLRGSRTTDEEGKKRFVATVNVWAAEHGLVLDQRRIPEEGSEITALQEPEQSRGRCGPRCSGRPHTWLDSRRQGLEGSALSR